MEAYTNYSEVFNKILIPTLIVVLLVILIIFLIKLITLITRVTIVVDKTDDTVISINKSIDKIQAPLDTAVKLSNTVSGAHDGIVNMIDKTKEELVVGIDNLKAKLQTLKTEKKGIQEDERK